MKRIDAISGNRKIKAQFYKKRINDEKEIEKAKRKFQNCEQIEEMQSAQFQVIKTQQTREKKRVKKHI